MEAPHFLEYGYEVRGPFGMIACLTLRKLGLTECGAYICMTLMIGIASLSSSSFPL